MFDRRELDELQHTMRCVGDTEVRTVEGLVGGDTVEGDGVVERKDLEE